MYRVEEIECKYESTRDLPPGIKRRGRFWFSFKSFTTTALSLIKDYQSTWYLFLERGPIRRGRATWSTFEAFYVTCSPKFAIDLVSTRTLLKPCQRESSVHSFVRPEYPYGHRTRRSISSVRSGTLALSVFGLFNTTPLMTPALCCTFVSPWSRMWDSHGTSERPSDIYVYTTSYREIVATDMVDSMGSSIYRSSPNLGPNGFRHVLPSATSKDGILVVGGTACCRNISSRLGERQVR